MLRDLKDHSRNACQRSAPTSGASADHATFNHSRTDADVASPLSDAQWRRVVDTSAVGIWTIDLRGRTTFVNPRMAQLLGFTPGEMLGRAHTDFMWEEDRWQASESLEARGQGADAVRDQRYRHKGGTDVWTVACRHSLRDDAGHVIGAIGLYTDITRRKQVETALQGYEQKVSVAMRAAHAGIWSWDCTTNAILWSPELYALFALEPEQGMTQERWEAAVHTEDRERMRAYVAGLRATGWNCRAEFRVSTAAGELWLLAIGKPERDAAGNVARYGGIVLDITDKKAAEEELLRLYEQVEAKKTRLALVIENIQEEVWFHDAQGRVTLQNRMAIDNFGDATGRWAGDQAERVSVCRPDGTPRPVAEAPPLRALAGEPVRDAEELVLIPGTGQLRTRSVTSVPARNGNGELLGAVSVVRDVTEAKRIETELRRTDASLRTADRRKDAFLATLAHELRSPLAALRNVAQILSAGDLGPSRVSWARDVIERQATQIGGLLDDLLDVARITQGKLALRLTRVPLADLVATAVEATESQFEAKAHRLTVALPVEPVFLMADPVRLVQVLSNLLGNACKYTDRGGEIAVSVSLDGGELVLSVKDTGIGIPVDALEHIFEMYSQLDGESARSEGGLGIGLALVKGIVRLHGGTIDARSGGAGQGSEFRVRLPIQSSPPAAAAEHDALDPAHR